MVLWTKQNDQIQETGERLRLILKFIEETRKKSYEANLGTMGFTRLASRFKNDSSNKNALACARAFLFDVDPNSAAH